MWCTLWATYTVLWLAGNSNYFFLNRRLSGRCRSCSSAPPSPASSPPQHTAYRNQNRFDPLPPQPSLSTPQVQAHYVHPRVILFIHVSLFSSTFHSVYPRVILFIHASFCSSTHHSVHPCVMLFIPVSFCSSRCH